MTDPSEVTISDAEVAEFRKTLADHMMRGFMPNTGSAYRSALAAFLAPRVPDALPEDGRIVQGNDRAFGWNRHRDAVLLAAKVKK